MGYATSAEERLLLPETNKPGRMNKGLCTVSLVITSPKSGVSWAKYTLKGRVDLVSPFDSYISTHIMTGQ